MSVAALAAWRDGLSACPDDETFRTAHRSRRSSPERAQLTDADWLELASMHVCRREIGNEDWADCIDKAVLLACRAYFLVGRQDEFAWWRGSKRYRASGFLDKRGVPRDIGGALRRNTVRSAAQTRSAYAPVSQHKNFRFFRRDGSLTTSSIYSAATYRSAGRSIGAGQRSGVLDALDDLAREPWDLPLRAGDVLVFDFRWHQEGGYTGHVPTICYFDGAAKQLAVVEDHLPIVTGGKKVRSASNSILFSETWDYIPGFNPQGGTNLFSGRTSWGRGGIFHSPRTSWSGLAWDRKSGTLVPISEPGDPDDRLGRNWAGFVGFGRYACHPDVVS